ncbi:MAG TPA: sialidase family protein [Anaerolineae bacterium]|nr:sialidase family protein [Anaerolineae bacterium]
MLRHNHHPATTPYRLRIGAMLIVLLTVMSLRLSTSHAVAQGNGWSTPVLVSEPPSSWFSDIVVAPDGAVHIIWSSGKERPGELAGYDLLMHRALLPDGIWSPINDISNPGFGGFAVRNSIILGRDGRFHILLRSAMRVEHISVLWEQASSAAAWSPPRRINSGRNTPYYTELATDSRGTLHAVWTENTPDDPQQPREKCSLCSDLYYRHSSDGGDLWSTPINLSQMPQGTDKPQIKIDQRDRIHVAWDEGLDRNVASDPLWGAYRRSDDGGITWTPVITFSLPTDLIQQTTLGVTGNGNPIAVYRATASQTIYYQSSPDGGNTWNAPQPLLGVLARSVNETLFDGYSTVTDGAGRVHLFLSGLRASDAQVRVKPLLLHLVWDGRSWSTPEVVIDDGLYPEWPNAVVDGNTLHLTWFTRSEEDRFISDRANYQVWYSRETLDGPPVNLLPTFTPMPTATPWPTPTPIPTTTPWPTFSSGSLPANAQAGQPNLENHALTSLFLGAAPIIIIAAVVVVVRRVQDRA